MKAMIYGFGATAFSLEITPKKILTYDTMITNFAGGNGAVSAWMTYMNKNFPTMDRWKIKIPFTGIMTGGRTRVATPGAFRYADIYAY